MKRSRKQSNCWRLAKLAQFNRPVRSGPLWLAGIDAEALPDDQPSANEVTAFRNAGVYFGALDRQRMLKDSLDHLEAYLRLIDAIEVSLNVSLESVLSDYFKVAPPFSKQKPKEFPDAFAGASLVNWLAQRGQRAYVVGADHDWEEYCALHHSLIHAKSISDVISRAVVSADLHAALTKEIEGSAVLFEKLEQQLLALQPPTARGFGRRVPFGLWVRGPSEVKSAKVLGVTDVNVVDNSPPEYACEIQFEAKLTIRAMVVDETETTMNAEPRDLVVERSFIAVVELLFGDCTLTIQTIHDLSDQLVVRPETWCDRRWLGRRTAA